MVHYIVINDKHFVRTIFKTLLKNTSKPKAATASKGLDNLLALMAWLSGKVFNKIENDLRIHAWIKHMIHFFTFHLLHTPLFFKHPFSALQHSQLILHVLAILSGLSSSITEIIGPCWTYRLVLRGIGDGVVWKSHWSPREHVPHWPIWSAQLGQKRYVSSLSWRIIAILWGNILLQLWQINGAESKLTQACVFGGIT